jgi:hypothetical protein
MIGMIGVIGKDVLCTARGQKRLYRRYRGVYRRYRGGVCMTVQSAIHVCRQTKSIMCMHMRTCAQNVFADRGNEFKQALFDRRLWKELDLPSVNPTRQSQDSQIRSKRS